MRWALEAASGPRVLDLGAGTGKLTATLVALGVEVIAVEPDPAMLSELRRALPSVRALPGSAEAIPLPDASVDAVLAGHALHWFDMDVAGPEIARVLVPDGILAGLWNVIDDRVDWVGGLERVSGSAAIGPRDTLNCWRAETAGAHLPNTGPGRPVRLARAGRVPARAAPHRRLTRRVNRDEGGDAGYARTRTRGHARSDPRFPREQTRDRPRRVQPPHADRRAAGLAPMKATNHLVCASATHPGTFGRLPERGTLAVTNGFDASEAGHDGCQGRGGRLLPL